MMDSTKSDEDDFIVISSDEVDEDTEITGFEENILPSCKIENSWEREENLQDSEVENVVEDCKNEEDLEKEESEEKIQDAEEEETEDDFLVVGCESDDDIDSVLKSRDEENNQKAAEERPATDKHPKKRKLSSRKQRKSSKRKPCDEVEEDLKQQLALSDTDDEEEDNYLPSPVAEQEISKRMMQDFQLDNEEDEDDDDDTNNSNNNESEVENKDDEMVFTIYSLGNYCPRMLRGWRCAKESCSWIHYMQPSDASMQFFRILSNRPQKEAIKFCKYFTNMEIQEKLVIDAQERLGDDGSVDVDFREVCASVLKSFVRMSGTMDLSLSQLMEIVHISSGIFDVETGSATLVNIFNSTLSMINDTGGRKARQEGERLVRWAWTYLYLPSVSQGVILPSQFYTHLTGLLSSHKMIAEMVEVLLYTSIMPSLKPPLRSLADVLTSPSHLLLSPHSTAVFTGQALSRLSSQDWTTLYKMENIKPGLKLLMDNLVNDDPADVYKFYESLPEIEGLTIPEIAPPEVSNTVLLIRQNLQQGDWTSVAEQLIKIKSCDMEQLSDFTEKLLMEISQLSGEYKLLAPVSVIFRTGANVVLETRSSVHTQFWCQLGASLLLCETVANQWQSATNIIKTMTSDLSVDWIRLKPSGITQFVDIDQGMVTLFVLESLVQTDQTQDIIKYLKDWDCLACLESELAQEKRDLILLSVLEKLVMINMEQELLNIIIRISEVMFRTMEQETDAVLRRRHEALSNVIFMLMLNENLDGPRLYKRYVEVRRCRHNLEKVVIRGLVTLLAHHRNNMIKEATKVYLTGVKWGAYCNQQYRRPFTLKLTSVLTMEELFIIVNEFFTRMKKDQVGQEASMTVFFKMEELSVPNCGVRHLNSIGCSKKDAMFRLEKVLVEPLKLQKRGIPFVENERNFTKELKEINSPVKSNSPPEEEIVEVNVVKKEITTLRPKLVRIKTSRGDKLL